ncbi:class II glutamine amidotransferase [Limnohabitans sp. DCL3]|uniref:class II glutamine amidotransferase n=1 Tax=Limnohabitans sp. DCL3 TaxID=3374103 RepID=UPI003A88F655
MCQLMGMSCNNRAATTFSFTGFSARGGRTSDHVDGWGIAFYDGQGCRVFQDDQPASESPLAEYVRSHPIKSKVVVAHVRKATQGDVQSANCHPFQREWLGRTWVFAHNGDLGRFQAPPTGQDMPVGTTDSERAFCALMGRLRQHFKDWQHPPEWPELAPVLAGIAGELAQHGNFNMLLSDGHALYVHCSTHLHQLTRHHPFPKARLVDCDMSLDLGPLNAQGDVMSLLATEPLTVDEPWQALRTGEFRVYVDGHEVWRDLNPQTTAFAAAARVTPLGRLRVS